MDAIFEKTFERIIGNEGNFQDDPKDRGNWTTGVIGKGENKGTKFGIAAMSYPTLDIKNLTLDQAKQIYFNDWWIKMGMQKFPAVLQYQMIDAAINHGMSEANKMVQRAVSVNPDGIIGSVTLAKIKTMDPNDLVMHFLSYRLEFMTNISTWSTYGKGWSRRIAHNLRFGALDN